MTNCKDCTHWNDTCTNKQSDCYGQNTNADNGCVWGGSDWIRVEDGLPEAGQKVLCWCEGFPVVGWLCRCGWWECGEYHDIPVTHWQPLPQPPRNDELPMPESVKNDIYDAIARGENYDGKRVSIHHSDVGYPDKTKDE